MTDAPLINEKNIKEWLDLCPCKDLVVEDENYFNPRNNFNRIKTITLYLEMKTND